MVQRHTQLRWLIPGLIGLLADGWILSWSGVIANDKANPSSAGKAPG